jgi:hypothetical protein
VDISIVVATCRNPQGCYLTVFALLQQMQNLGLDYEIIIAADGGTEYQWEKVPNVRCLRIHAGSPQGTRDSGIRAAQAESILVIEDHVVVSDIKSLLNAHNSLLGAMTFPSRRGEGTSLFDVYGTTTNWDGNLWFKQTIYAPNAKPHRVPQFGHSCFMVSKAAYRAVGGYTDLLIGYGGEETLLCLKFWMMGFTCWQVPSIWHNHFLSDHGMGGAMLSDQYQKNFAITKYVLTGSASNLIVTPAMKLERDRICSGPFGGDINLLRAFMQREGIS